MADTTLRLQPSGIGEQDSSGLLGMGSDGNCEGQATADFSIRCSKDSCEFGPCPAATHDFPDFSRHLENRMKDGQIKHSTCGFLEAETCAVQ